MQEIKVFKFGGASVNSAIAVRNMVSIVRDYSAERLVVVVSAMGKTTNLLETLVPGVPANEGERRRRMEQLRAYHLDIANELFVDKGHRVFGKLEELFVVLDMMTSRAPSSYNFDYDQTVSFGELLSTTIVAEYLAVCGIANTWVDARELIRTDSNYREGHVDWPFTEHNVQQRLLPLLSRGHVVTQGFIGGAINHTTTTLGREGSDYSAAVLSYCLDAASMTIWKDVPGFLNADPKYFHDTVKIDEMPYNEALELAYYGASVIHPKTVKPIQNKNITLHIKSFVTPQAPGSVVGPFDALRPATPLYIFKNNQILLSILPRDVSFIAEDNLQTIFATFATLGVKVNLMQNSALSFSVCLDDNPILLRQLQEALAPSFHLRYNDGLQLITVRYHTPDIVERIVAGRPILLQQQSRVTTQLVVENR